MVGTWKKNPNCFYLANYIDTKIPRNWFGWFVCTMLANVYSFDAIIAYSFRKGVCDGLISSDICPNKAHFHYGSRGTP